MRDSTLNLFLPYFFLFAGGCPTCKSNMRSGICRFLFLLVCCVVDAQHYRVEALEITTPEDKQPAPRVLETPLPSSDYCCDDCPTYSEPLLTECKNQCRTDCYPCKSSGYEAYASWCKFQCTKTTTRNVVGRCQEDCRKQFPMHCPNRCADIYPECDVDPALCALYGPKNCYIAWA